MDNYQVSQAQPYPQQVQTAYQPQAAQTQSAVPTTSGVNIIIQNPTASPNAGGYQNPIMPCYPSNYYTQQPVYNMGGNTSYSTQTINPVQNQTTNNSSTQAAPVTPAPAPEKVEEAAPVEKKEEKKEKSDKTKEVVQLTDDYIKTLENYLRNSNKEVRIMGAKELSKRFEEDKSRKNDRALNSLLNLTLQDKSQAIRSIGLAITSGGLAQGDSKTVELLKGMQSSSNSHGQDALIAAESLLKMSGEKVKIPDDSPAKKEKE